MCRVHGARQAHDLRALRPRLLLLALRLTTERVPALPCRRYKKAQGGHVFRNVHCMYVAHILCMSHVCRSMYAACMVQHACLVHVARMSHVCCVYATCMSHLCMHACIPLACCMYILICSRSQLSCQTTVFEWYAWKALPRRQQDIGTSLSHAG